MSKFALGLCTSAFLITLAAPAFAAETITGVVERLTVTLKMKDGTSKQFEVRGDVNLNNVDEGDEVQLTVDNNEVTSIKVTKEEKDASGKK
jgi:hypothetical protein